jgi:hypothetical protein
VRSTHISLAFASLLLVAAIGAARAADSPAFDTAVTSWLGLLDAGRYDDAWREASDLLHQGTTQEQWTEEARGLRAKYGHPLSHEIVVRDYQMQFPGGPDGKYFTLRVLTKFDDAKQALEIVTVALTPDLKWRVAAFGIKQ